MFCEVSFVL